MSVFGWLASPGMGLVWGALVVTLIAMAIVGGLWRFISPDPTAPDITSPTVKVTSVLRTAGGQRQVQVWASEPLAGTAQVPGSGEIICLRGNARAGRVTLPPGRGPWAVRIVGVDRAGNRGAVEIPSL